MSPRAQVPHIPVLHSSGGSAGLHRHPSSTSASQSLSTPSQISESGPMYPTPPHAPQYPSALHVWVPETHAPTSLPQGMASPGMQSHPSSMLPSQSSSREFQSSASGPVSPRQSPQVPAMVQVWSPSEQAPTFEPQAIVSAGVQAHPSSTMPLQSESSRSPQVSAAGKMEPKQALHTPSSQVCVPCLQVPTLLSGPQERTSRSTHGQDSSIEVSQSLSTSSPQISASGPVSPRQSPQVPAMVQVWSPSEQAPTFEPQAIVSAGVQAHPSSTMPLQSESSRSPQVSAAGKMEPKQALHPPSSQVCVPCLQVPTLLSGPQERTSRSTHGQDSSIEVSQSLSTSSPQISASGPVSPRQSPQVPAMVQVWSPSEQAPTFEPQAIVSAGVQAHPSSTMPLQSESSRSPQVSAAGKVAPKQALHSPSSQVCVPCLQVPTLLSGPQERTSRSTHGQDSSIEVSQSLSTSSPQISASGPVSPRQSPQVPATVQVWSPSEQAPTFEPQAIVSAGRHTHPSSTMPWQSESSRSPQESAAGKVAPKQALHSPSSQVCVPCLQVPTLLSGPQERTSRSTHGQDSSIEVSQSF